MQRLSLCSLLLVLALTPTASSAAEDSPEWVACTARAGTTDNAIVAACTSVLSATKEPPNRLAEAAFSRGLAEQRLGDKGEGYADFAAAQRFDPKFTKGFVARGLDATTDGKFDVAIKEFNQAIAIDPKLVLAYYGRGLAYDASRQFDRAIKDYQQALGLDPKFAMAYFGLGLAYHGKAQFDRSIESYNKAIELDPQYAQALYNRGNAYGAVNKVDRAIADYSAAIRIDPKYAKAYYMRGLANRQTGNFDQALADLDAVIRLNPDFTDAVTRRNELLRKVAETPPPSPADKPKEDQLFGLFLAKWGDAACHYADIDDDERKALDREVAGRIGPTGVSAARAAAIEARAKDGIARKTASNPKFCGDAEFAVDVRELFDASADRPKRSR